MDFMNDKDERKNILAFLCVCIVWGSTYLAIRIGVSAFPPALFAGLRFLLAGLAMVIYACLKGLKFPNKIDIRRLSIVGLFLLVGGNGLVVLASQWVHSGITSLIVASMPIFMALIELCLPKSSRIAGKGWFGLILGFSGVVLLVITSSGTGAINVSGALILICATLFWSIGSVYSKQFRSTGSIVTHIGIQMLAGGIVLTSIGIFLGEVSRVNLTLKGIGSILYLAIFGSVLAYSCYIYILMRWPASKAGTYAYVNPLVAIFLGFIVLKEPISLKILICTGVILMGVFLVQTSKLKPVSEAVLQVDSVNTSGEV
ncbi:EamA family transporter [Alkaliphilus peptidifermentans]|uniref:Permease of the drug/metabolite transporter (DMT) superfamily n=1 Tax=Alkaliphilus peptidifermentans DSM 18978 TaxID=1120976 RepID=A0A1G5G2I4_9FIRM|nr:EamA family transporter [Alkaliphilus peptidifermentans]SCY45776.1 Permease of the drug/metabolite transporter (DMT) superfamily [Alkaliphilus peptidifermentans DSM 18978]